MPEVGAQSPLSIIKQKPQQMLEASVVCGAAESVGQRWNMELFSLDC